jgi:hypothetical protein
MTQVIPANSARLGKKIFIHGKGIKSGAANNKAISFFLGASEWVVIPAANDQLTWDVNIVIHVDDYNSQRISMLGVSGTTVVYNVFSDGAIDMGAATTAKFMGTLTNGADTITQELMDVEIK